MTRSDMQKTACFWKKKMKDTTNFLCKIGNFYDFAGRILRARRRSNIQNFAVFKLGSLRWLAQKWFDEIWLRCPSNFFKSWKEGRTEGSAIIDVKRFHLVKIVCSSNCCCYVNVFVFFSIFLERRPICSFAVYHLTLQFTNF